MILKSFITVCAFFLCIASCGSTEVLDESLSASPGLLELSFEERMAVRARLTTLYT
jgi:hypothetical protein